MLKFLLMTGVMMPFCMDEAGGEGGDAGAGGAGGEAPTNVTADGTGGTASMLTGDAGGEAGGDGDQGSKEGGSDFNTLLGEDLAKNPGFEKYAKAENPVQEMAKSLLEAQSKIGKPQIGVPGEESTPEERAAFNEALGVPKDAAGYGFEKPEGMDDAAYNKEHADKWAALLHDNNIPGEAANALREAMFTENQEAESVANEALNTKMDEIFGDDKQLIAKQASQLMQQAIPDPELRAQIQASIGNENTPAFAAALGLVTQHMQKTYGLTDQNLGDGGGDGGGQSITEIRADAQKLMSSPAYRDRMHKDHSDTKSKVDAMYLQVGELTDAARKK